MCAVTARPYLCHPPPAAFDQAWRRATVLPRECAVTVMTRVARPVPKCSGSGTPCWTAAVRGAGARRAVVRTAVGRRAGALVVRAAVVGLGAVEAGGREVVGVCERLRTAVRVGRALAVTTAGARVTAAGDVVPAGVGAGA